MSLTRSLGVLVTLGVPAIIGSGFVWSFFENWTAVYAFLVILAFTALGFVDVARK